jgi:hypothetical protein
MQSRPFRVLAVVAALAFAGCQLTLVAFVVPPTAAPGQVFEVLVQGTQSTDGGSGGCVLQLPVGFTVVGSAGAGTLTVDEPALLATYVAEPGHYLTSWSKSGGLLGGVVTFKIFVRAPAAPTSATIKVALAATPLPTQPYAPNSPAGVTAFAQIVAPANALPIAIVAVPASTFAVDAIGLPLDGSTEWTGVAFADLDGDGDADLAGVGRPSASGPRLKTWFRTGGAWIDASTGLTGVGGGTQRIASGDFDGDGFADVAVGGGAVWFGDGLGGWTQGPSFPLLGPTLAVAAGDVDGDGRSDVAFGGYSTDFVQVFRGNANRTFTAASTGLPNAGSLPAYDLLLRDVTGDGNADVVWNRVYAGDGLGNWTAGTGINGVFPWGLDAGDLDGDGLPELVFADANSAIGTAVYRHLGGNQWAPVPGTGLVAPDVASVAVLDFDRDGRNDVVVGARAMLAASRGIEVFRNLGATTFALVAAAGLPSTTVGVVHDLAVGDANGDTFPDLAVAIANEGVAVHQNWLGGLSRYGTGCAAPAAAAPSIGGSGAPAIGNAAFALVVGGGAPGTFALCWLGVSQRTWSGAPILPLDLAAVGAPGCTLWAGPESLSLGAFDPSGTLVRPVPVPPNAALLRQTFFAQGAAFAPAANAFGFVFSAGLAIRVQ